MAVVDPKKVVDKERSAEVVWSALGAEIDEAKKPTGAG